MAGRGKSQLAAQHFLPIWLWLLVQRWSGDPIRANEAGQYSQCFWESKVFFVLGGCLKEPCFVLLKNAV